MHYPSFQRDVHCGFEHSLAGSECTSKSFGLQQQFAVCALESGLSWYASQIGSTHVVIEGFINKPCQQWLSSPRCRVSSALRFSQALRNVWHVLDCASVIMECYSLQKLHKHGCMELTPMQAYDVKFVTCYGDALLLFQSPALWATFLRGEYVLEGLIPPHPSVETMRSVGGL